MTNEEIAKDVARAMLNAFCTKRVVEFTVEEAQFLADAYKKAYDQALLTLNSKKDDMSSIMDAFHEEDWEEAKRKLPVK